MAKEYFEKLGALLAVLDFPVTGDSPGNQEIVVKHFFSGAALYVNGTIRASWSPVGLAFKLPDVQVDRLLRGGKAIPLKYFPKGHVKPGYALFEDPDPARHREWKKYFLQAMA